MLKEIPLPPGYRLPPNWRIVRDPVTQTYRSHDGSIIPVKIQQRKLRIRFSLEALSEAADPNQMMTYLLDQAVAEVEQDRLRRWQQTCSIHGVVVLFQRFSFQEAPLVEGLSHHPSLIAAYGLVEGNDNQEFGLPISWIPDDSDTSWTEPF